MSTITRTADGQCAISSKELLIYLNMMKEDPARAFLEIFRLGWTAGRQNAEARR